MEAVELVPEKRKHDIILLQNEYSEYLYKRENEIQDKIENEQPLTPEEWHLFWLRKIQHLQDAVEHRD